MSEKIMVVSKEQFSALVNRCFAILVKHGFEWTVIEVQPTFTAQLEAEFARQAFGMFCDIEESEKPVVRKEPEKRKTRLTGRDFDLITLECSLIYARRGSTMYYNECLNVLRSSLEFTVVSLGYECPNDGRRRGWTCYKTWEDLATKCGLTKTHIARVRGWWLIHDPAEYEA